MKTEYTEKLDFSGFLQLLHDCNQMAKSDSCPRKIRNKFYKEKHNIIKYFLSVLPKDMYSVKFQPPKYFLIQIGDWKFHSPVEWFPNLSPTEKLQDEYIPKPNPPEYEEKLFDRFWYCKKYYRHLPVDRLVIELDYARNS